MKERNKKRETHTHIHTHMMMMMLLLLCVCVCVKERKKERDNTHTHADDDDVVVVAAAAAAPFTAASTCPHLLRTIEWLSPSTRFTGSSGKHNPPATCCATHTGTSESAEPCHRRQGVAPALSEVRTWSSEKSQGEDSSRLSCAGPCVITAQCHCHRTHC